MEKKDLIEMIEDSEEADEGSSKSVLEEASIATLNSKQFNQERLREFLKENEVDGLHLEGEGSELSANEFRLADIQSTQNVAQDEKQAVGIGSDQSPSDRLVSSMDLVNTSHNASMKLDQSGTPTSSWSVETMKCEVTTAESLENKPVIEKSKTLLHSAPVYKLKVEPIKPIEKYDAYSEDEEPILRTEYTPFERIEDGPRYQVKTEQLTTYDVRKGVPQPPHEPLFHIPVDSEAPSKRQSKVSIRKSSRYGKGSCSYDENFNDMTPHQRDLPCVSMEQLSPREVMVIKGLWKCITFDLWTFGALTTINIFKIRGHLTNVEQKATPEKLMECKFLWPHANHAMKSLELVVMNLHNPTDCHNFIYDIGRKHSKSKIPFSRDLNQMIINAFLLTFSQHVHPKMSLEEMRTLRKFCNIIMHLITDASLWDSSPVTNF